MTLPLPLSDDQLLSYLEGSLAADTMAAIERQLIDDPAARETLDEWQRQNAALAALYQPFAQEPIPQRLAGLIAYARVDDAGAVASPAPALARFWVAAAMIAVLSIGSGAGWFLRDFLQPAPQAVALATAAMLSHDTYVVEVAHPVEVLASDTAHMNKWMTKRLGRDMHAPDFTDEGFALMGGRIVPSDQGIAALYMYDNAAGQRITVYVVPKGAVGSSGVLFAEQGKTQSFYWIDRDLSCAVVGSIPREILRQIAAKAYDQLI